MTASSFGASCPTPYQLLEDGDPTATAALCENLHQYGYAIVRFSPAAEAEVAALRTGAADFFGLATADKAAIGDFRFVGDTYAGYRDSIACDAEFLEMHTDSTGGTYPALAKPLGLSAAVAALHTRLDGMSRRILSILAAHIGVAEEALLSPLDPPTSAPTDATEQDVSRGGNDDRADLSASVLRVCHYRRRPGAVGAEADAGPAQADAADAELEVLFDAHTDSSLLTLSTLCPSAPGLQLQVDGKWLSVERLDGVGACDVEVHVGDFLCFLSREYFPSCVHRVVRPIYGPGRLSFPFLVRPRQDHVLETRRYDPEGTNPRLIDVSGIKCRELRKLFDVRGKRLKDEGEARQRAAEQAAEDAEAKRKARAAAFRAKLLANGGRVEDSSSSEVEEEPLRKAGAARVTRTQTARTAHRRRERGCEPGQVAPTEDAPTHAAAVDDRERATTSMAPATEGPSAGVETSSLRPAPRAAWALGDLGALHYSSDYLFVFKQHDLHMDHAEDAVTLATQLNHCFPQLADTKCRFGFRHVHQLDYATSGVLCVALNKKAAGNAGRLFEQRLTSKFYLALVAGHTAWDHLACSAGVGDDVSDPRGFRMAVEGQPGCSKPLPAHTDLYVVARGALDGQPVTKLLMVPKSGRRHQLRVHALASGHPIIGDVAYTGDTGAPRMMLHAWRLRLPLRRAAQPICVGTSDPFPFRHAPPGALPAIVRDGAAIDSTTRLAIGATVAAVALTGLAARARPSTIVACCAALASGATALAMQRATGAASAHPVRELAAPAPFHFERVSVDGCVRQLSASTSFDSAHVLRQLRTGVALAEADDASVQTIDAVDVPPPAGVTIYCAAPMGKGVADDAC